MDTAAPDRWWRQFRQVGGVSVVHVDLTPHEDREATASAWLDLSERSRTGRFQHAAARRRFVLCRAALRSLLCAHLGCENAELSFASAEGGKPFALVDGEPVDVGFNVSHSGRHGLIALAAGRVGVDVEEYSPRRDLNRLATAVFGPNEQADFAAAADDHDRIRVFYRLWTLKEAVAKALGVGLSFGVSRFEIPAAIRSGTTGGLFRIPQVRDVQWQLTDIGDERFAAAAAHEVVN